MFEKPQPGRRWVVLRAPRLDRCGLVGVGQHFSRTRQKRLILQTPTERQLLIQTKEMRTLFGLFFCCHLFYPSCCCLYEPVLLLSSSCSPARLSHELKAADQSQSVCVTHFRNVKHISSGFSLMLCFFIYLHSILCVCVCVVY